MTSNLVPWILFYRFEDHIKPKAELLEELNRLKQELESMECPIVLCHNDLLLKNIIYNKQKGKTIFYADTNVFTIW